jgi:hypothetical protein
MPDPSLMSAKMRAYMEQLSPAARAMLIRAMRSADERGESDAPTQAILKAAAKFDAAPERDPSTAKPTAPSLPWDQQIREAFFAPVQPFTVDLAYPTKIAARIQRRSLDGIWTFLTRDLAPVLFSQALALGITDPKAEASAVARKLRRELTPQIVAALSAGDETSKPIRRLAGQLGSEMALPDLADVIYVFQKDGAFLNFAGQLPKIVSPFELSEPSPVSDLTKKAIDVAQIDPAFVAVVLLRRASAPASVALLAMTLAGSTDPRVLQTGPYAKIVETVIAETEIWAHRFEHHLANRPLRLSTLEDLREYHDLVRQLELSLQPNQVPAWHRRLGAARKQMSDLIAREIEPLPGAIRRALRVESATQSFAGQFDIEAAYDAEFGIRLMLEARNALDSLALNELVTKLRRPVEQTLEVVITKLMTELKSPTGAGRADLVKAVDAAIRMSAIVFGDAYAVQLRKSRDNAINKPAKAG